MKFPKIPLPPRETVLKILKRMGETALSASVWAFASEVVGRSLEWAFGNEETKKNDEKEAENEET